MCSSAAPVRAGDVLEVTATVTRVGTRSRDDRVRGAGGVPGPAGPGRVGRRGARPAAGGGHRDRHGGRPARAREPRTRSAPTSVPPARRSAVVDLADGGRLVGAAATPTTVGTDVLHGLDAAVAAATATSAPAPQRAPVRLLVGRWWAAAGGGRLRTAGHRAGRPAGRVVGRRPGGARRRRPARRRRGGGSCGRPGPDVVLLVGGTDGGDAETITPQRHPAGPGPAGGCRWCWPATPTSATS